jgi:uncharacterized protein (DUF885 family)
VFRGVARLSAVGSLASLLALAGCHHRPLRPAPPLSDEAESKILARLSDDYWHFVLEQNPLLATYLGDRRQDEELPDLSFDAHEHAVDKMKDLLSDVEEIDANKLAESDRVTRDVLLSVLHSALDT